MSADERRTQILYFADHVSRDRTESPEAMARSRNWLTSDGRVTDDGHALIDALDDQHTTRTVFRGNF